MGIQISQSGIRVLGFADGLDILGESLEESANTITRLLDNEAKKIDLQINNDKTEIIELVEINV